MKNLFGNSTEIPSFDSSESFTDYRPRIDVGTLGKIAQLVLAKPRIAVYEVTLEKQESPFFEEVSTTRNSYYIIGEIERIDKLISEDKSKSISLAENNINIRNINREDILFLFEEENYVNKLNHAILELGLDVKHYNFMWSTVDIGISEDKIVN